MGSLIIWLDSEKAKIFHLNPEGVSKEILRDEGVRHLVEVHGRNHPIHQTDEERFYRRLSHELSQETARDWFLIGPGTAKEHFVNHLKKFHPQMKERIVGSEKTQDMSDAQILRRGGKFFEHHYLFKRF